MDRWRVFWVIFAYCFCCLALLSNCRGEIIAKAQEPGQEEHSAEIMTATPLTVFPVATPTLPIAPVQLEKPIVTSTVENGSTACDVRTGRIETGAMPSALLQKNLPFRVYLPACYNSETSVHYPVLYLLHGQGFNDDQWDRLGAGETADRLVSVGAAPPFVIVMPREELYLEDVAQSNFGKALVDELVPYIEKTYAVCAERNCRAVGGISRGAGWAMHLGMSEWQIFGALGAHSFPPVKNDILRLPDWLRAFPANQRPRIYIDVGNYDRYLEPAVLYHSELIRLRVPHDFHLFDGMHNEDYWRAHVEDYLRWYAAGWQKTVQP